MTLSPDVFDAAVIDVVAGLAVVPAPVEMHGVVVFDVQADFVGRGISHVSLPFGEVLAVTP